MERVGAQGFTSRIQGGCVSPGLVYAVPVQFTGTKLDTGYFRSAVQSLAPVCRRWRAKPKKSEKIHRTFVTRGIARVSWKPRGERREAREVLESSRVLLYHIFPRGIYFHDDGIIETFVHTLELELFINNNTDTKYQCLDIKLTDMYHCIYKVYIAKCNICVLHNYLVYNN